jgi:hypothetical protein
MTPELRTACEVVFQEHKTADNPITWNRNAFRGRISIGLCEMAKETLLKRNVIYFPNRAKKTITLLNPAVAAATTFEEAAEMAKNKVAALVPVIDNEQPVPEVTHVPASPARATNHAYKLIQISGNSETAIAREKWYLKPLFYYVVWPICGLALGVLIAYLMNEYVSL